MARRMVDFDVPAAVAASRKLNAAMVRFVPSNILRTVRRYS